jgi:hypothetical protein
MRNTQLQHCWLRYLLVAITSLAGCNGYPTEDRPTVDVFSMDHTQRIARLNHLGKSAQAVNQWRYHIERDCALEITVGKRGTATNPLQLDLRKNTFKVAYRNQPTSYDVQAERHSGWNPGVPLLPVFAAKDRGTALEVTLLVKLLARDCQADTEDKASMTT